MLTSPSRALQRDAIVWDDLLIYQWQEGYRFSRDSVVLARTIGDLRKLKGVDLGTGCGVVAMVIVKEHLEKHTAAADMPRLVGIEVQESLAELATTNVKVNQMSPYIQILKTDLRQLQQHIEPESIDFVVCNPPYHGMHDGRMNPSFEKAAARHAVYGTVANFLAAAAHCLRPGGRLHLIFPFERLNRLLIALKERDFGVEWIRPVQSTPASEPKLALIRACKHHCNKLEFLPALIYRDASGRVTAEMQKLCGVEDLFEELQT